MPTLYLVRHGQASFGAADYDQLSELGTLQCQRLGEYFRRRGLRFGQVLRGTLKRHAQSLDAIANGMGEALPALEFPGLNEYDSHAVIRTVYNGELRQPANADEYRHHFRLLREGLTRWMAGEVTPAGMPSFTDFSAGVQQALDHVRARADGDALLVSSGGPIATAVAAVLGAPAPSAIELNLRIRNSAVTEFSFTPKRHLLHNFNHLPHLDDPACADWITYT